MNEAKIDERTFDVLLNIPDYGTAVERNVTSIDIAIEVAISRTGYSYISMISDEQTKEVVALVYQGKVYKAE